MCKRLFAEGVPGPDVRDTWEIPKHLVGAEWNDTVLTDILTTAKKSSDTRTPFLEAMLRQFEYEADLLAADGKTGVDTAWLSEQLDMPNDLAD
jgi:hypothetical protein